MSSRYTLLVADSDAQVRTDIEETLKVEGFRVIQAADVQTAIRHLSSQAFDAVVADMRLSDGSGVEILNKAFRRADAPVVVLTTEFPDVREVVEAIRKGALDVLEKPIYPERLAAILVPAIEERRLSSRKKGLALTSPSPLSRPPIIGRSAAIQKLTDQFARVAATPTTTVLIQGPSGSGKELVARAVHFDGERRDRPFMAINCAALNESILEAELFGYEKGSFTGASQAGKKGLFEAADGGTVFLDEIGEMSPGLQAKLLRVLQESTFKRVGGVQDITVDIRIIAATNRDLWEEVLGNRFRKDLYFRLNVMPIRVPALSERREDIPELARHFLDRFSATMRKQIVGVSKEAEQILVGHSWPGNVRELRNVCEYAVIVCDGDVIEPRHLALTEVVSAESQVPPAGPDKIGESTLPLKDRSLRTMEAELIRVVLSETRFNIARAARELGINRSTLYNKMKDFGLERDDRRELRQSV